MSKPRVIKFFDNLEDETKAELLRLYPYGFDRNLVTFRNHKGELITALPYENETHIYMIKMSRAEAQDYFDDLDEDELNDKLSDDDDDMDDIEDIPDSSYEEDAD